MALKSFLYSLIRKKTYKEKLLDFLKKHLKKISNLKENINGIAQERKQFSQEIWFSNILRNFIQEIKYYPNWIKQNRLDGSERFNEIFLKRGNISSDKYIWKLKKIIIKDHYNDNDDILEFTFESNNKYYTLYFNSLSRNHPYDYNWDSYYYSILIFESNQKLITDIDLVYKDDSYWEYYENSYLNTFKPNERIIELIIIMRNLINEKTQERKLNINRVLKENNERNFID